MKLPNGVEISDEALKIRKLTFFSLESDCFDRSSRMESIDQMAYFRNCVVRDQFVDSRDGKEANLWIP